MSGSRTYHTHLNMIYPSYPKVTPIGVILESTCVANLRYLAAGGWSITIERENADRYVVSGKLREHTMGGVHGVDVEDAVANAREWITKWEFQENQRIADRKVERT